jgi:L,D-peptidoglycan transpeptidase YkuD (ErfK/YbiS/YcfS/YnhG family)
VPPPAATPRPRTRPPRPPAVVTVRPRPGRPGQGLAAYAGAVLPCALGRAGIRALKREGDGATPRATLPLVCALWRGDRLRRPRTALPMRAIRMDDGWCDAAADGRYNRMVRLPFPASHEELWRGDGLYDVIVVLDFNLTPRRAGGGSAIFLHCAREGLAPTAGCVAFPRAVLLRLLARLPARARLKVG